MIEPRYAFVYDTVFRFMCENRINSVPQDVRTIALRLQIPIRTVTELCIQSGLSREDVIALCGNADGAVFAAQRTQRCKLRHTIVINDAVGMTERMRFTIAEECAHVLLGHTQDDRFDCCADGYEDSVYQAYEIEARTAAGLLIVSPRILQICKNRGMLNPAAIAALCNVSLSCARVRIDHFNRSYTEMCQSPYFDRLPISPWHLMNKIPKKPSRSNARKKEPYFPNIFSDM